MKFEKELYFNLNYHTSCNNNCLFCDSSELTGEISYDKVSEILNDNKLSSNDRVMFCGGEPTMHKDIKRILKETSRHDAYIYLLTNGRKLSNLDFAREIIESGVNRLSIPIYGHNSTLHDYLTQTTGSFNETVAGLKNLFLLRDEEKYSIEIELKALVCKPTYRELTKIVKLLEEFPNPNLLVISALDCSDLVRKNFDKLWVRLSDVSTYIKEAIDSVKRKDALTLYFIPLCILGDEKYSEFCDRERGSLCKYPDVYYDPKHLEGIKGLSEIAKGPQCPPCKYFSRCDGIWKRTAEVDGFNYLKPFI